MSGPVTEQDAALAAECGHPDPPEVELSAARQATVGGLAVRRALPRRTRRTVGAWCFADHFGPASPPTSMQVGPHPHVGLHTVTWLVDGELLHRDSLGSQQLVRPGQLNLMTAGHGVAHAEEQPSGGAAGRVHGIQLWVAQPDSTRHRPAAFEHHAELPQLAVGRGVATVLVGEVAGARSPARADSPLVGADIALPAGAATVPLDPAFEHALVVLEGTVAVGEEAVGPGVLAYLGEGREAVELATAAGPARAVLLGGEPFPEPILMSWNFVARERAEVERAAMEWNAEDPRFGTVDSTLPRIPAPTSGIG